MSHPAEGPPPVDIQAEPSERAGADAMRETERASLKAPIQHFNVNYYPNGGPPLPRLISPGNRRIGNPPSLPPWVNGGGPVQGQALGGGQAHQSGCSNSCLDQEKMLGI